MKHYILNIEDVDGMNIVCMGPSWFATHGFDAQKEHVWNVYEIIKNDTTQGPEYDYKHLETFDDMRKMMRYWFNDDVVVDGTWLIAMVLAFHTVLEEAKERVVQANTKLVLRRGFNEQNNN